MKARMNLREAALILLTVTVLLGSGLSWSWFKLRGDKDGSNVSRYRVEQSSLDKFLLEVQADASRQEYDKALTKIDKYFNEHKNSQEDRYALYNAKAYICIQKRDYRRAIDSYKSANDLKSDFNSLLNVATAAEAAGDSELAKEYYQKALNILDKNPNKYDEETAQSLKEKVQ